MLVDKYDSHLVKPLPISLMANPKLSRVPSSVVGSTDLHIPDLFRLKPTRKNSLNLLHEEKSSLAYEDNFGMRVPKVLSKNLPDVFLMNTPRSRKSR